MEAKAKARWRTRPGPAAPPCRSVPPGFPVHRGHLVTDPSQSLLAMVARTVTRRNISTTPAASQSLTDEVAKHAQKGAWDPKGVRAWQQVAYEVRKSGGKAHAGRILGIVVEKHPERPPSHPERKFIGRLVSQGNEVDNDN